MAIDLLNEKLLSVETQSHASRPYSLPDVLARLSSGERSEFPLVRPHQESAWFGFLVQVSALVACRLQEIPESVGDWHAGLLDLAAGRAEAWTLLVEDATQPAFLQSPVVGSLAGYETLIETPDDLDVLVTAKGHDVKSSAMVRARPEHWVYSLVTQQTTGGWEGRGHYPIARMNGGYGNRPTVTAARGSDWHLRFRREVEVWLGERERLCRAYGYAPDGTALLWLDPWDGASSQSIAECDPFFVEICRLVRLVATPTGIAARFRPTSAPRLHAKDLLGDTGDPWTPVQRSKDEPPKALTVGRDGFSYRRLQRVLFEPEFASRPNAALEIEDRGEESVLIATALARGQGKTEGFHRREIPLPREASSWFGEPEKREALRQASARLVTIAQNAERSVLHPALCALMQGADELDLRDRRPDEYVDALDRRVDSVFFDRLFRDLADPDSAHVLWQSELLQTARAELLRAIDAGRAPEARRERAVARAENLFNALARKHLPGAFASEAPGEV